MIRRRLVNCADSNVRGTRGAKSTSEFARLRVACSAEVAGKSSVMRYAGELLQRPRQQQRAGDVRLAVPDVADRDAVQRAAGLFGHCQQIRQEVHRSTQFQHRCGATGQGRERKQGRAATTGVTGALQQGDRLDPLQAQRSGEVEQVDIVDVESTLRAGDDRHRNSSKVDIGVLSLRFALAEHVVRAARLRSQEPLVPRRSGPRPCSAGRRPARPACGWHPIRGGRPGRASTGRANREIGERLFLAEMRKN